MGLGKKVGSVVGKPRVLDGGMLIVFLLLATGVIWGLLFGSSQVAQPLPLPTLRQGNHRALAQ